MAAQPPDSEIENLLAELRSEDAAQRKAALDQIGKSKVQNNEIVDIIKTQAQADPDEMVRYWAKQTLMAIGAVPASMVSAASSNVAKPARVWSRNEKIRDFLIGMVGWYVVNGAVWLVFQGGQSNGGFLNLLILPINVVVLLVTAFTRRYFALGLLASFAFNLLAALMLGATLNAFCWIPFFIK